MDTAEGHGESRHASELCTACGMCCSGALFNSISLSMADFERAMMAGLRIDSDPDDVCCIRFPCVALDGAVCRVYEHRPEGCRAYRCQTLQALDRDEITVDQGLARIAQAVALWRAAEAALAPDTIPGFRTRRADALDRGEALPDNPGRAAVVALDEVLDAHFRLAAKRQGPKYAAIEGRESGA